MWPVQLAFLLFVLHTIFLSSLTLLHSSHDRSNGSSPSFSSTTFQNCPGISDLRSEVSDFQYRSNLCTEPNSSLIHALNSIQFSGVKNRFLVECRFCHENPGFYFICTSCIVCCHATHLFKIFHILRLFLIYNNMCRGCLFQDSYYLRFFPLSFPFLSFLHLQLVCVIPSRTVSSVASSTKKSAYFTVRMTCPIFEVSNPSRASLVKCSLYNLNRTVLVV